MKYYLEKINQQFKVYIGHWSNWSMVFENKGSLRYHALWAYTGISALALVLDKIPLPDVQALVKHRNATS
jgi:hypothetical protein